ncbi:sterol desaturase family protein [Tahibacter amnicola]|uniref:Sterol desaturase family protein n=1 Tax=Tahibacter amnicola TaxID=2976241 RepID=A0ABY6BE58_9GAMM|nr:sterol desaturase family protein [Tahibacter amnicola]UXI66192.1 sterol desaturase family protein [Tahibacter amnicola]
MRILLLIAAVLLLLERLYPAHKQPASRHWVVRALALNLIGIPLLMIGQKTWIPFFKAHPFIDQLQSIHPVLGGFVAFLTFQFFLYWWHRLKHTNNFLWRTLHQMHHSPRRIEVLTAYYGHPLDGLGNLILSAFVCWCLLGLHWTSVAWFALIEGFYDYFTHSNLRTPYWIGYFIQRPEMHRVHHEHNVHASNYSLPIWDMLFGTHVNPKKGEEIPACGFDEEKEMRLGAMLLGRDVHRDPSPATATVPAAAATESGDAGR